MLKIYVFIKFLILLKTIDNIKGGIVYIFLLFLHLTFMFYNLILKI